MVEEVIVENAVVLSVHDRIAEVSVIPDKKCEECSAKIICKPDNGRNIVRVDNLAGAVAGDNVKIEIKGNTVLFASFLLYGIPLLILIAGIFSGLSIFSGNDSAEIYSVLFGIGLMIIYFFLSYSLNKRHRQEILPKIVFIERIH
ncbi:MAG TPA: SoxR reducing system RseC family protein [Melioribacteraceae bacterium]|nr:SoxR reducing system RseC family protein [Melioribacteraceae bacterium]